MVPNPFKPKTIWLNLNLTDPFDKREINPPGNYITFPTSGESENQRGTRWGIVVVIHGVDFPPVNGLINNWRYNPHKWIYFTPLRTGFWSHLGFCWVLLSMFLMPNFKLELLSSQNLRFHGCPRVIDFSESLFWGHWTLRNWVILQPYPLEGDNFQIARSVRCVIFVWENPPFSLVISLLVETSTIRCVPSSKYNVADLR